MNRLHYPTLITNCVKWLINNNSEHLPNAQNILLWEELYKDCLI